jgi:tRNA dimethylallyltransferase
MNVANKRLPLIVIAGPTASAKSALALALSRLLPVTIVNADASQVYRDLPVLSAAPGEDERKQAPHRLYGYLDGAESCSAARWAEDAKAAIAKARNAYRLPVLVGGTGLYLRTLIDGIAPVPEIDPDVRAAVRAMPVREAYAALSQEDAQAAAKLSPADTTRVARALEVVRSTGKPIAAWQAERVGGIGEGVHVVPAILLPPRDWLNARCDARFAAMLAGGAAKEVEALLARRLNPVLPVMRAIGVREIAAMLAGDLSRDAALAAGQLATRQYAKRQYTWFRNQPPADWRRHEAQLDADSINELAIILRDEALTG